MVLSLANTLASYCSFTKNVQRYGIHTDGVRFGLGTVMRVPTLTHEEVNKLEEMGVTFTGRRITENGGRKLFPTDVFAITTLQLLLRNCFAVI